MITASRLYHECTRDRGSMAQAEAVLRQGIIDLLKSVQSEIDDLEEQYDDTFLAGKYAAYDVLAKHIDAAASGGLL
jgi:hypothetical protein